MLVCQSLESRPTQAQEYFTLVVRLYGTTSRCLSIQPFQLLPSRNIWRHISLTWPFPHRHARPDGQLMSRNSFTDFAVEHRFSCPATEPGFAGDIGTIEIWLNDYFFKQHTGTSGLCPSRSPTQVPNTFSRIREKDYTLEYSSFELVILDFMGYNVICITSIIGLQLSIDSVTLNKETVYTRTHTFAMCIKGSLLAGGVIPTHSATYFAGYPEGLVPSTRVWAPNQDIPCYRGPQICHKAWQISMTQISGVIWV